MPGPVWLRHIAEIRAVPVDRALVARGALGMLLPLAVGQLAGRPDLGAAAGLGAYGAAVDDTAAPWRTRALTLLLPQLGGAIGLALGRLTGGQAWAQILLVAVVALVSGLLSTIGRISDMAALVLLLATAMGLGLPTAPAWWQVPLLFLLGGIPLMLLSLTDALRHPGRAERRSVAGALRAVADLLDAPESAWAERRHQVTVAMDAAYDTVVIRRLSPPRPGSSAAQLAAHLDRLIEVIAAAPAVRTAPARESAAEYADAVRRVADAVETRIPGPIALPPAPQDRAGRALRTAVAALATPGEKPADGRPRLLPTRPTPLRRLAGAVAAKFRNPAARRYALRLTACLTVAQAVASLSGLPRSGWLVLTVALIVRPGLGTVPARLVTRVLGTTAGVLIGLAVTAVLPAGWWRIAAVVVLTGLLQAYARRNYALQTLFLTPVMLLLADPLGQAGSTVPRARLIDTVIGCALAFIVGYVLWPEDTRARVDHRLATAHEAIAAYADAREADGDAATLHTLRRRIHGDLAAVRTELIRLRTDPRHHHTLQAWQNDLDHAEAAMTRLTSLTATGHHGTPVVTKEMTRDLSTDLRRRAARLRERRPRRVRVQR
ncbi:FUSC family protein [Streptomyces sp. NBC_00335]|uniref:FUSC family protein n=1 Tax=unclassified Streptomyces TaxID=2593676 RepID=UPI00225776CE|nr:MULTISPECIES: FUSC family protein [unclassified Streptomyces]MCX5408950.1 FUSC family protein [Streptomyces sp. NBC_00086]